MVALACKLAVVFGKGFAPKREGFFGRNHDASSPVVVLAMSIAR